ncbi:MAG: hypothetical protein ACJ76H_16105 [Bacteriovoracaceae bacterium]
MADIYLKVYPFTMQAFLKKHGTGTSFHAIKVSWTRTGRTVVMDFTVTKRSNTAWVTDPSFGTDWNHNWGLWNKDVVEAFLQLRRDPQDLRAPYLEVQVSPMNQPFALLIEEPRKVFHPPGPDLIFSGDGNVEAKVWNAHLEITLPAELRGELLYGGFFSCLLEGNREFYALEPNPEDRPDFHRPELFLPLDHE